VVSRALSLTESSSGVTPAVLVKFFMVFLAPTKRMMDINLKENSDTLFHIPSDVYFIIVLPATILIGDS
jgi:hypothetical protein